jgi:hypothetical protein
MFGHKRSQELRDVDAALAGYDVVRGGTDLNAREQALYGLIQKIKDWKDSKATATDKSAWKNTARSQYITALELEQAAEMNVVVAAKAQEEQDRKAAALVVKQAEMDRLIKTIGPTADAKAKAKALLNAYLTEFRGKARYTTTTPKNTTVWDKKGTVACSMISNGLIDLLRHAGVKANLREIKPKNFVTKKLGGSFIDPGTEGNVRLPGGTFAAEKRFFFNKHWIVDVEDGALYLDPTSGIEVGKDAPEIIDYKDMAGEPVTPPAFNNGTWRVHHVGNNALGDGAYELTRMNGA